VLLLLLVLQGPRCSLRSKKMYSDAYPDYLRMTALNLPAALLVLGVLFSIDDITGMHALLWGLLVGCLQVAVVVVVLSMWRLLWRM
jgi:hypothetical protein